MVVLRVLNSGAAPEGLTMNAVDRLLADPGLTNARSTVAMCGRKLEGAAVADDFPTMAPNDAALILLQQMARDMRATSEKVGTVAEAVARMEGLGIDKRLNEHNDLIKALDKRVDELEADRRAQLAQHKPWVFLVQEASKLLLAAAVGAAALIFHNGPSHH